MGLSGSQGRERRASCASSHGSIPSLTSSFSTRTSMTSTTPHRVSRPPLQSDIGALPAFVKPTPARIPLEDLEYLTKRGALTLPSEPLRSELLNSHFNFVHPFMPLLNRKDFLSIVTSEDGSKGKVSLLLLQAVMFTGSAVCFPSKIVWDLRFCAKRTFSSWILEVSGWLGLPPARLPAKPFSRRSGYVKILLVFSDNLSSG